MGEEERLRRAGAVYQACWITDRLFAMNPFLPKQNFYSQQLRALALVEVIAETHLPLGKRNVLVVGAGVAGRTLAAALAAVGASVRIFEARQRPFERYRHAIHRELHPNVIFWPAQQPVPTTALPFLNWAQASAQTVTEELADEWKSSFGRKIQLLHEEVTAIGESGERVELEFASGGRATGDLCILAMGFKDERSFGTLKSAGYWTPEGLALEDRMVLVSGSGDGGLIDVLSPVLGTNVTRAAHLLAIALTDSPLKQDIVQVEADRALKKIAGTNDSAYACDFYSNVTVPPDAIEQFEGLAEAPAQLAGRFITLLYHGTSAFSFTAAPINKLLLAHFSNTPKPIVRSVKGALKEDGARHEMACDDGTCECLDPPSIFDKILVRHGAEPGVCAVLNNSQIVSLRNQADCFPEAAEVEGYNHKLYRWNPKGMGKSGVELHAMPKVVRRAISRIGLAYDLDLQVLDIGVECFTGSRPIQVTASLEDRRKADKMKLFPLQIGPATVRVVTPHIRRNEPDDE